MNVKDSKGNRVQAHDRRCPGRPCFMPLLMAIVGSEDVWQCRGWDGNEEPCPCKLPKKEAYCVGCEFLKIVFRNGGDPNDWAWACKKYKLFLRQVEKNILKCKSCLWEAMNND